MGQRSTYAAIMDARNYLKKEECALGMEQSSNDTAVKDAQIQLRKEVHQTWGKGQAQQMQQRRMCKESFQRRIMLESSTKPHSLRWIHCFWTRIREDYCDSKSTPSEHCGCVKRKKCWCSWRGSHLSRNRRSLMNLDLLISKLHSRMHKYRAN